MLTAPEHSCAHLCVLSTADSMMLPVPESSCSNLCVSTTTGLMMLAAAKAFSASSVAITDIRPANLPVALALGAHYALDQSQAKSSAETVQSIMAVFPEGPDIVIDCVGMSSTISVWQNTNAMHSCHVTSCMAHVQTYSAPVCPQCLSISPGTEFHTVNDCLY